jgi:DNA-binding HxlR family transcriptional regulator
LRGVCAVTIEILAFGLTLEHIACEGIIKKLRDPEHGSKRIYRLTPKGIDRLPIVVEMILWSAKCDLDSPVTKAYLRRARRDREGLQQFEAWRV